MMQIQLHPGEIFRRSHSEKKGIVLFGTGNGHEYLFAESVAWRRARKDV